MKKIEFISVHLRKSAANFAFLRGEIFCFSDFGDHAR